MKEPSVEELEKRIESHRNNADLVIRELDRRRHEAFDWRLQLKRHGVAIALVASGLVAVGGGLMALSIRRERRRQRVTAKAGRLWLAIKRMVDAPERVASEPSSGQTAVKGAASALGSALAKKLVRQIGDNTSASRTS